MRRRGLLLLVVVVVVAAVVVTYKFAYRIGESDAHDRAIADRSLYQTRVAGTPVSVTDGQGQAGGGARGQNQGQASGSATGGTPAAGGAASATGGTGGAGRQGNAASLTGRVTKVDGTTLSVQQTDNATVNVTTDNQTAVRKLVAGALSDLKSGDFVTVDGSKGSDNAVMAKTITSLGQGGTSPGGGSPVPGGGGGRPPGGAGQGANGPAVFGQIQSLGLDGGTMTVQGTDGTMVTVKTDASTIVRTQQPGALTDIKAGDFLLIQGEKTGDAAFLARAITDQGASSG